MKRIILSIFAAVMITLASFRQTLKGFKYQAVIRDAVNSI